MLDRIKRAEKSGFLSLKDYGLNEIPPEVFGLANLKTLILSNNPIQTIPKEIGALKALKTLQVADCSLFDDSIPEELTTLPLEEITLTSNGLTNFELLTKIASLKKINLGGNDIVEIPTSVVTNNEIKNLKNLELLNLSKNNISDISQVLDALSDIKLLVIISNKNLTHNPVDEGQLEKLAKKTALVASVSQ